MPTTATGSAACPASHAPSCPAPHAPSCPAARSPAPVPVSPAVVPWPRASAAGDAVAAVAARRAAGPRAGAVPTWAASARTVGWSKTAPVVTSRPVRAPSSVTISTACFESRPRDASGRVGSTAVAASPRRPAIRRTSHSSTASGAYGVASAGAVAGTGGSSGPGSSSRRDSSVSTRGRTSSSPYGIGTPSRCSRSRTAARSVGWSRFSSAKVQSVMSGGSSVGATPVRVSVTASSTRRRRRAGGSTASASQEAGVPASRITLAATTDSPRSRKSRRHAWRWILPLVVLCAVERLSRTTACGVTSCASAIAVRSRASSAGASATRRPSTSWATTISSAPSTSTANTAPQPVRRRASVRSAVSSMSCG